MALTKPNYCRAHNRNFLQCVGTCALQIKCGLIIPALVLFLAASAQNNRHLFEKYSADSNVAGELQKAKRGSDPHPSMIADGFWIFMDKKEFEESVGKQNPVAFFDTVQIFTEVVCDCMIKKDTVYLRGGIGYEGAIGFDLRIAGNLFNGRILLAGKSYRTNASQKFRDEILLNSIRQTLKIESRDSLKLNKTMIGELILESEDYFEKGNKVPSKIFMKVLFGCKLDDVMVL